MKKSLLALAVLGAFASAAQAQSAVTIYGSFDGGVRYKTNVNAAGDNLTTVGSTGTYNSNRIGFRGVEDLVDRLRSQSERGVIAERAVLDHHEKLENRVGGNHCRVGHHDHETQRRSPEEASIAAQRFVRAGGRRDRKE